MRFLVCAGLAALLLAGHARAEQPWAEAGDMRARQDVELLKAARYIRGPIESWPLPWSQIADGVDRVNADGAARPHVRAAARRLGSLARLAERRSYMELRVGGTSDPALIRGFNQAAREEADVAARISRSLGNLYISAGVGYRNDQRGRDFHLEPSYINFKAGNWGIYGGYVEKYWGPSYEGGLVLSNNARPFPKAGITRMHPHRPEPKFMRWLGPWRFDFFGGVLSEERRDANNPVVFGMRFSFEPGPGLEINLNRTLLICGGVRADELPNPTEGGRCDAEGIVKGIIPFFPGEATGDSLAGLSVSYTRMFGPVAARVYYDVAGEDKDSVQQFDQVGQTGGGSVSFPLGQSGASVHLFGEYTDTLANFWFDDELRPGSFYNNFFYFDGKTYRGEVIGHPIDTDSRMLSVGLSVTDSGNRRYYTILRDADLYYTGAPAPCLSTAVPACPLDTPANRLTRSNEAIFIATAGMELPTRYGDFRVEGRYMDDTPDTPGRTRDRAEVEVGWRTRF